MQCQENQDDLPNCGIINILNSKGTLKEAKDPNKNYYCFYDLNGGMYVDECVKNSDNIKKCINDFKNLTQPPLSDQKAWETLYLDGFLPKADNRFPGGFSPFDGTCIVPDKYLKNPPEKVDKPSTPPTTPPATPPATPPSPYVDPYSILNNILNNIFNNENFDISEYKNTLKYLENIKPEDIKNLVSSYIQNAKTNNSYEDIRQNIIKIFNTLNNNKDVINLTVNFSVDIINDLQSLFNEINNQMKLSDSQKFSLDVDNLKNNLVTKIKNSEVSPDTDSKNNNCVTFSTESIIVISILTFLLILFAFLWVFKK
jgi:hypothetical protein